MLRPKKSKKERVKLSKESIAKAKGIFAYLKPYRGAFAIGWIFLVLSSSAGLFFPYLLGQLLGGSDTSNSEILSGGNQEFASQINLENINTVALLLIILLLAQSIFSYFRVVIFTRVTENALRDIRKTAFDRLIHMPMDFFNKNKVGELTSRLSADINLVQETMRTTIAELFRQLIIVVGSIVFIALISWKLVLIMLCTVPVVAIFAVIFGRYIKKLSKQAQDAAAASNTIIEENLMGISNVKAFTNEAFAMMKYAKTIKSIRDLNIKSGNWRGLFVSFIITCLFGAIVFVIWQGLHMTEGPDATLSRGDFNSFVMFTVFLGASIGSLPDLYASSQKAIGATENLMQIIEEKTETETLEGKQTPEITGKVEFLNVNFSYPQRKDVQVMNGLSLSANTGDTIALVGSSGAGKSTVASLLLNYYTINSGEIKFDDKRIEDIDVKHLRQHIAIVPQEVILFGGTIEENIAFGRQEATKEEIRKAAQQANALDFIESFPKGMQTEVGDRGIQLSGGQKQRIAIARALLKNPTILILDEATSALDSESEKSVQEALETLMEGRTSFVIAHRLSTIRKANTILVLENGTVVESGTHEALSELKDGVYANLSQLQSN
ncbi:MAG: ABC transporter ATP-binding protein [Lishizhenia sp.]